jgi:hypothetical protein
MLMRTAEILDALTFGEGIELHATRTWATVTTLYHPSQRALGSTIFGAAIKLAQQMLAHPECPLNVRVALEAYDEHSRVLQV